MSLTNCHTTPTSFANEKARGERKLTTLHYNLPPMFCNQFWGRLFTCLAHILQYWETISFSCMHINIPLGRLFDLTFDNGGSKPRESVGFASTVAVTTLSSRNSHGKGPSSLLFVINPIFNAGHFYLLPIIICALSRVFDYVLKSKNAGRNTRQASLIIGWRILLTLLPIPPSSLTCICIFILNNGSIYFCILRIVCLIHYYHIIT